MKEQGQGSVARMRWDQELALGWRWGEWGCIYGDWKAQKLQNSDGFGFTAFVFTGSDYKPELTEIIALFPIMGKGFICQRRTCCSQHPTCTLIL